MDRAHVLGNETSIRVEKLLIISAVEAITVDADRVKFPQLEAHATIRATEGESILRGRACRSWFCLLPSSLAYPWCETGAFDFQPVTVPLRVSVKRRTWTGVMFKPWTHDPGSTLNCFHRR